MKKEIIDKIAALMTAAFGLIAALAWNDAIKSLFAPGGALAFVSTYGIFVAIAATFTITARKNNTDVMPADLRHLIRRLLSDNHSIAMNQPTARTETATSIISNVSRGINIL